MNATSDRSAVINHDARKPGHGSTRTWERTIGGRQYSFTAVLMPNGERRYVASYLARGDGRFACDWKRAGFWATR